MAKIAIGFAKSKLVFNAGTPFALKKMYLNSFSGFLANPSIFKDILLEQESKTPVGSRYKAKSHVGKCRHSFSIITGRIVIARKVNACVTS